MSVCFKCDACGKLYEPYTTTSKKVNGIILSGTEYGDPNGRHKDLEIYDLCEDCLSKILAIIPYNEEEEDDGGSETM